MATLLVILSGVFCPLSGQEPGEALIGTINSEKHEQSLYVVSTAIVDQVARSKSNLVSRIFVFTVTQSDCCDPKSIGGGCYQCCDNPKHVICTKNSALASILGRIKAVSEGEWKDAQLSGFKNVADWIPISSELESHPIREISKDSAEWLKFWQTK